MRERFTAQKKEAVNEFTASVAVGDVDEEILPLLKKINAHPEYYTTSSCAGRIVVFQDMGGKFKSKFKGKWHGPVTSQDVLSKIAPCEGTLWFRVEPPIIHVGAANPAAAGEMIDKALTSGFKRTGMQSVKEERYMLEILSTERFDAPIMHDKKMLVSHEYIRFLVELANEKIVKSQEKIKRLEGKL